MWTRRLVLVAIVLAAAGALAIREAHRGSTTSREVREFILALCDDVAKGYDPAPRLAGTDHLVAGPLLERLRRAGDAAPTRNLSVRVSAGDVPQAGSAPPATHTAVLRAGDRDVLGIRVVHSDPGSPVVVVGYWTP